MPVLLKRLSLAGMRAFGKQAFDRLSRFEPAFLLNFVNPIGHCLDDFTRSVARHLFPRSRLGATRAIFLLYYSNGLFLGHFRYLCYSFVDY
jgi:hypothetical protein